ncbi:aquaporin-5-like [Tubulanus polymorphus]|uniref:aquaporin-5-like n=1 Tax=Tubulanus polymorphus TaxID=672921 RepID=UPI003DA47655
MGDACLKKGRFQSSLKDLKNVDFYKAVSAEFVGALLFLFIGVSATFSWPPQQGKVVDDAALFLRIGAAFGFAIATTVWITAGVSGGHINPAVSLGMLVARKISFVRFVFYAVAQCLGAMVGVLILKAMIPASIGGAWGLTKVTHISVGAALFFEAIITFGLVITVFASCDGKRTDLSGSGPLAIGIAVFIAHLGAIPVTGASMNPARSFGSAVASGKWTDHWVYWIGPMLGAVVATLVYELVFAANASRQRVKCWLTSDDYDSDLPKNEYESGNADYEMGEVKEQEP